MPLAQCIRRCWDSQATRRYWQGDVAELPEDHVFLTGKIKCFEIISPEKLAKTTQETDAKIMQMAGMIAELSKRLDEKEKPADTPGESGTEAKKTFKCSVPGCNQIFSNGFDLGKHKKADHPQA